MPQNEQIEQAKIAVDFSDWLDKMHYHPANEQEEEQYFTEYAIYLELLEKGQEQPTQIYEIRLIYTVETTKYIEAQNQLQADEVAKILYYKTDVAECECVDSNWNAYEVTSRRELARVHKYDGISHELEDVLKMLKEQDYKERQSFLAVKEKGETHE